MKKKSSNKRYSFEEMKRFIYSFAEALSPGGKPVFSVNASRVKNRYFFRVKTKDDLLYGLSYTHFYEDIGTFGKIDALFREANPKVMLRPQVISIEELVYEFNIDMKKLFEVIFKKFKKAIADGIRCRYGASDKMHFNVSLDMVRHNFSPKIPIQLEPTPDVSSIEELIVWADLKAGVHG